MGVSTKTTARHYAIGGYCQSSLNWTLNAPRLRQPRRPLCAEPAPQHERASCALRESLLAALDETFAHAPLANAALCVRRTQPRGAPPVQMPRAARGRRRSCHGPDGPGTGLPITVVRMSRSGSPLATARALSRPSTFGRGSCCPTRLYARTSFCARCRRKGTRRFAPRWTARAARSPGCRSRAASVLRTITALVRPDGA